MGNNGIGSPSFGKSVRSLTEALSSLERELEILLTRAGIGTATALPRYLASTFTGLGEPAREALDALQKLTVRGTTGADLLGILRSATSVLSSPSTTRTLADVLGLADERALDTVRAELAEVVEQVGCLREREVVLAGGLSGLRARATRFEEALAGLARVQGRCLAQLEGHKRRSESVEGLARRRDDHITRLIRDTEGQRAEIERLSREMATARRQDRDAGSGATADRVSELTRRVEGVETNFSDFKRLQKTGNQGVIESLEALRDRVARLETRAAEMAREARAKSGRLDALARHVGAVENRLSTALGKGGQPVVAVARNLETMDQGLHVAG
jgi:hypothetical protein